MALQIKTGKVIRFEIFDVANEIKLQDIEKTLKKKVDESKLELYRRFTPEYINYQVAPLLVKLVEKEINIVNKSITVSVHAKIYDIGVISIISSFDFSGSIQELYELTSSNEFDDAFEKETEHYLKKLSKKIEQAFVLPSQYSKFSEIYNVFYVKEFDQTVTALQLLSGENKKSLAQLIRFDSKKLSEEEIEEVFKEKISYYDDDLVVSDINSCFIFDSIEPRDIIDAVEYAKLQLVELRYYDASLDKMISKAFTEMKKKQGFSASYEKILSELRESKLTVAEIIDRIDNVLKLIGDNYLARVYKSVSNEFHLYEWKSSVDKKLRALEDIYSKLNDAAESRRDKVNEIFMIILEILIVIFFAFEIWKSYFS